MAKLRYHDYCDFVVNALNRCGRREFAFIVAIAAWGRGGGLDPKDEDFFVVVCLIDSSSRSGYRKVVCGAFFCVLFVICDLCFCPTPGEDALVHVVYLRCGRFFGICYTVVFFCEKNPAGHCFGGYYRRLVWERTAPAVTHRLCTAHIRLPVHKLEKVNRLLSLFGLLFSTVRYLPWPFLYRISSSLGAIYRCNPPPRRAYYVSPFACCHGQHADGLLNIFISLCDGQAFHDTLQ